MDGVSDYGEATALVDGGNGVGGVGFETLDVGWAVVAEEAAKGFFNAANVALSEHDLGDVQAANNWSGGMLADVVDGYFVAEVVELGNDSGIALLAGSNQFFEQIGEGFIILIDEITDAFFSVFPTY